MLKACSMSKSIDRQAVKILKEKGILFIYNYNYFLLT